MRKLKNKRNIKLFLITLIVLEIVACYFAYYTLGEVKQFFWILIFALNIIPLLLYYFKKKIASLTIGLTIGVLIIPYQIFLVVQWVELKKESSMIVKYVYNYQTENGEFPNNIADYEFENNKLAANFLYDINAEGFRLLYYIGTKGTYHFYYHNAGKWAYYPD